MATYPYHIWVPKMGGTKTVAYSLLYKEPRAGKESKMATEPLLYGVRKEPKWLHDSCRVGVPHGEEASKWLHRPCHIASLGRVQNGYITPTGLYLTKTRREIGESAPCAWHH